MRRIRGRSSSGWISPYRKYGAVAKRKCSSALLCREPQTVLVVLGFQKSILRRSRGGTQTDEALKY